MKARVEINVLMYAVTHLFGAFLIYNGIRDLDHFYDKYFAHLTQEQVENFDYYIDLRKR